MHLLAQRFGVVARFLAALALVFCGAFPAFADEASDKADLDKLFAALKVAPDAASAHLIDELIWLHWTVPSDPMEASRMRDVMEAMTMGNYTISLKLIDSLLADYPTYAEAWNKRATVNYLIGDYDASLADIAKTLEFEPRHFGALTGRVLIYLSQGKRALALKDMAAALAVHPFLSEQSLFPELQRDMTRI